METFAFKVKILENQASISMYSSASYLRDVFGNHLLSKLITTSKMDSVIINFNCAIAYYRKFELLIARVVESEDFLGFRLRLLTPTPAVLKTRLRLQHFWKPDSDSSNFEKATPTPAENMRLHRLRLHNPSCHNCGCC